MSLLLAIAMACLAQDAPRPAWDDPRGLSLDELIERLPRVGEEWAYSTGARKLPLVPVAAGLRERIERGDELTPQQWQRALTATGALRVRERWPASEPFALSLSPPGWLRATKLELRPHAAGLSTAAAGPTTSADCGTFLGSMWEDWRYQALGTLPAGPNRLVFDASLRRGRTKEMPATAATGVFFRGELCFDVEVVETLDDAIPPRSSEALDAAVRDSLWLSFDSNESGRRAHLVIRPDAVRNPELAGVALSLDAELRERSVSRETLQLRPVESSEVTPAGDSRCAFWPVAALPASAEHDAAARRDWTLRVRGTTRGILGLWNARSRWSGELEIGLDELIARWDERNPDHVPVWRPRGRGVPR